MNESKLGNVSVGSSKEEDKKTVHEKVSHVILATHFIMLKTVVPHHYTIFQDFRSIISANLF